MRAAKAQRQMFPTSRLEVDRLKTNGRHQRRPSFPLSQFPLSPFFFFMRNKSVLTFVHINEIFVCLSVTWKLKYREG